MRRELKTIIITFVFALVIQTSVFASTNVTKQYTKNVSSMLSGFDSFFGYAAGSYSKYTDNIYTRTNMVASGSGVFLEGKTFSYAKSKLASRMKLFFGSKTMKFRSNVAPYGMNGDSSCLYVLRDGKLRYGAGDWGDEYPKGKVAKILKDGSNYIVTYNIYNYDGYYRKFGSKMGVFKITMKKASNKYKFIVKKIKKLK